MPIEYLTFRKQLILKIISEEGYPKIQIGIKKARLILANIQAIENFVQGAEAQESLESLKESAPEATEAQESPKEAINTQDT